MYSNTNSFLGGNSLRPGPQQYGGSFNMGPGQQQPQLPQLQQCPFAPQPTGFGQAPLIQQYTGFPGVPSQPTGMQPPQGPGQLQAQYTGFPGQQPQQSSFSAGAPPMPAIPQQFQQQFQQQQQHPPGPFSSAPPQQASMATAPVPAPMKPQPTGFSGMAATFQTGGAPKPVAKSAPKKT